MGFGGSPNKEYLVSLSFMGINIVYENVVHLPFSLYSTFVIEQRHGFNKQTLGLFFLDKLKVGTRVGRRRVQAELG
jgi:STE24 endopeptidase